MTILTFKAEFSFLSNFYHCNVLGWPTLEHAYMAAKSPDDKQFHEALLADPNPANAKRLGRHCTLRSDWAEVKNQVMWQLLTIKFSQQALKKQLIETAERGLIEGNYWHDKYWGKCYCEKCNGQGKNTLGRMLMLIRTRLTIDSPIPLPKEWPGT